MIINLIKSKFLLKKFQKYLNIYEIGAFQYY